MWRQGVKCGVKRTPNVFLVHLHSVDTTQSTSSPLASSTACSSPSRQTAVDNNWHFSFGIPWNQMPSEVTRKLENKEGPTGRERKLFTWLDEILTVCQMPGKKHFEWSSQKDGADVSKMLLNVKLLVKDTTPLLSSCRAKLTTWSEGTPPFPKEESQVSLRIHHPRGYAWILTALSTGDRDVYQPMKHTQEELKKMYKNRSKDKYWKENASNLLLSEERHNLWYGDLWHCKRMAISTQDPRHQD
jgi:hypothetical protein